MNRTQRANDRHHTPSDRTIRLAAGFHPASLLDDTLPGLIAGFSVAYPPLNDAQLDEIVRAGMAVHVNGHLPGPLFLDQHHSDRLLDTRALNDSTNTQPCVHPPAYDTRGYSALDYDGAMASLDQPGLLLIKTADCVPILAVDGETGRYAALHAGWRGTAAGILIRLLGLWSAQGSSLGAVRLAFGPHIRACCYEVGPDCLSAFTQDELRNAVIHQQSATHLDLGAVLLNQAQALGIARAQVEVSTACTRCTLTDEGHHPYASYRRVRESGVDLAGRNLSLIGSLARA